MYDNSKKKYMNGIETKMKIYDDKQKTKQGK